MARGLLLVPLLVAAAQAQSEPQGEQWQTPEPVSEPQAQPQDTIRYCECLFQGTRNVARKTTCRLNQVNYGEPLCETEDVPYIPDVYVYTDNDPQRMFKIFPFKLTARRANEVCIQEGGRLATPKNKATFNFLGKMAKDRGLGYVKVGYTDEKTEGVWTDLDGFPAPSLPWDPPNPDNFNNDEDCLEVRHNGNVNDIRCDEKAAFVCERLLRVKVPKGYKYHSVSKMFYKLYKEEKPFHLAKKTCEADGGTLAVPEDYDKLHCVIHAMGGYHTDPYVDFTDEAEEGNFVTSNGRRMQDMEVELWRGDEPDNGAPYDKPENCVTLNHAGFYADVPCQGTQPFICELIPY